MRRSASQKRATGSATSWPARRPPTRSTAPRHESTAAGRLMAHRAFDVADLEEPDLAHVHARERVRDEGVQPRLLDVHVEDRAAAGGHEDGLDVALVLG